MYCIAMSKCGLWEHCVQAALYEAQPQPLAYVTGSTFHALNWNNMPFGIPLINVIHLAFSYLCIKICIKYFKVF